MPTIEAPPPSPAGSVLAKNAIPVLHSSAAMLKVAEMEYSGANSIFLRWGLGDTLVWLMLYVSVF